MIFIKQWTVNYMKEALESPWVAQLCVPDSAGLAAVAGAHSSEPPNPFDVLLLGSGSYNWESEELGGPRPFLGGYYFRSSLSS